MSDARGITFEQVSRLHSRKDNLKETHVKYVESHPELKQIMADFLSRVLLEKPDDIRSFAKDHFAAYLPAASDFPPLVICGPSGVGKGTLIKRLTESLPGKFGFSVSHTTRGPREGEEDGVHYHFTDRESMQRDVESGLFIEHAEVHGNLYGTSVSSVATVRDQGLVCILDIDVQGVKAVQATDLQARCIYVAPPSREVLEERLRGRGTEDEEAIARRLENAFGEMEWLEQPGSVDATLVNEDLEVAAEALKVQVFELYPGLAEGGGEGKADEGKDPVGDAEAKE